MGKVTKLICIHAVAGNHFTVGNIYDSEMRGVDMCVCGDDAVSDLNEGDWYELSTRVDGIYFLIGFQQDVLFRIANDIEVDLANVVAFPTKSADANDDRGFIHERAQSCLHRNIVVSEKERQCRCKTCGAVIEAFDYLNAVAKREATYASNINQLRREEEQRRINIEKLNQIERNAKARAKRAEPDFNVVTVIRDYCERAKDFPQHKSLADNIIRLIDNGGKWDA